MPSRPPCTLCLLLAAFAPHAHAAEEGEIQLNSGLGRLDWSLRQQAPALRLSLLDQPASADVPDAGSMELTPPRFGDRGTNWITLGGGVAHDFSSATDGLGYISWSHFIDRNIAWVAEVGGWALEAPGETEGGVSVSSIFRWHFINEDRHSIFLDAGIGLLLSSDEVPVGGTHVNFMPRLGAGATFRLSDNAPHRLVLGARWHHISNARIHGDDDNPARDGLMLYAGVEFPF